MVIRFELPVSDYRVRDQLIDAIAQARSAQRAIVVEEIDDKRRAKP
ncbi:hypothetical protein [Sorangium sp. So ce1000]